MSFNPEDPKWTAYVLDELDAVERAQLDQELAQSSDARQLVAEIRETTRLLDRELQTEPTPALLVNQREEIERHVAVTVSLAHQPDRRRSYRLIGLAAAAALLIAVGGLLLPTFQPTREAALRTPDIASQPEPEDATVLGASTTDGDDDNAAIENIEFGQTPIEPSELTIDLLPLSVADSTQINGAVGGPLAPSNGSVESLGGLGGYDQKTIRGSAGSGHGVGRGRSGKQNDFSGPLPSRQYYGLNKWSRWPGQTESDRSGKGKAGGGQKVDESDLEHNWGMHDESGIPFDDRDPIRFPDAKEWGELTKSRSRRSVSRGGGEAGRNDSSEDYSTERLGLRESDTEGNETTGERSGRGKSGANYTVPKPVYETKSRGIESTADSDESPHRRGQAIINRLEPVEGIRDVREERSRLGSEAYDSVTDNPFLAPRENPLSTFSIDVDTASYSNIRRFLTQNHVLPPKGAVRIEEMINYFRYDYPQPKDDVPFSVTTEVAGCPWNSGHRLVRIGLKGREIAPQKRPPSNLVFLLDVSGSMSDLNKLPLVKEAMKLLTEQLSENDRVAIVVYAGASGEVLPSTTGDKQQVIREAIDRLQSGGSTNGGEGIQLAYDMAAGNFIKGGTNRVILATDGDFNVGITNRDDLMKLIVDKAKSGVFLTTLGFGMGNLKDSTLEQLADKGNGNYAYIDDLREAKKVFVEQMNGTLITIAKDVKIQIEFNPAEVASYRLIGYENRILAHQDFNDDKKDAGEIGAGHTVTALYEVAPAGGKATEERAAVDPLKYQKAPQADAAGKGEMLTLKLRYKQPDGDVSKLIETPLVDAGQPYGKATADFKFAASVALFGMLLRDSPHKGTGTIDAALELAREGLPKDEEVGGYRKEFIELVEHAKTLRQQ